MDDSLLPQFVSVSDLQRDYPTVLKKLKSSKNPVLILKKNNLEAVMITPDLYEKLIVTSRQYEQEQVLSAINIYVKEKKTKSLKKIKDVDELFMP